MSGFSRTFVVCARLELWFHSLLSTAMRRVPPPTNDPIRSYEPGSPERRSIKAPARGDGRRNRSTSRSSSAVKRSAPATTAPVVMPHDHHHVLGTYHKATPELVQQAIEPRGRRAARVVALAVRRSRGGPAEGRGAADARRGATPSTARRCWGSRRRCFRRRSMRRARSSTSSGSTCTTAQELLAEQPISDHTMWNQLEYRGARRIRLRGHAVQFHVDCREPADARRR